MATVRNRAWKRRETSERRVSGLSTQRSTATGRSLKSSEKTHLQIVGQLGPAGVTGVHGDEDVAGGVERQLRPFEHELL